MVGVGKNSLAAKIAHFFHSKSFDRGTGSGAYKSRSFDITMRGMNYANPRQTIALSRSDASPTTAPDPVAS